MASIGSKVMIHAIEDGTSIHGSMLSEGALAQAYVDGGSVMPDWTDPNNQPLVYVSVMKNGAQCGNKIETSSIKWYFNGTQIPFSGNISGSVPGLEDGTFMKTTKDIKMSESITVTVPALKIIKNIANANNIDNDVLSFSGNWVDRGNSIPLDLNIDIRIGHVSANGVFGVITPCTKVGNKYVHGGDFFLEDDIHTVSMYAVLYTTAGIARFSEDYWADWEVGASEIIEYPTSQRSSQYHEDCIYDANGNVMYNGQIFPILELGDADVVDYMIVRCKYWKDCNTANVDDFSNFLTQVTVEVDDLNDPEMMYISAKHSRTGESVSESGEGNVAYLRSGDLVDYTFWVGTQQSQQVDPTYNYFYVQFQNNMNQTCVEELSSVADPYDYTETDSDYGYRRVYNAASSTHKGNFTITYNDLWVEGTEVGGVKRPGMGGKVTGYLEACSDKLPHDTDN